MQRFKNKYECAFCGYAKFPYCDRRCIDHDDRVGTERNSM